VKYQPGPGSWCGTVGGYTNHACRCDECKRAAREYRCNYMLNNVDQIAKATLRRKRRYAQLRK
jgi:hypothetical protein